MFYQSGFRFFFHPLVSACLVPLACLLFFSCKNDLETINKVTVTTNGPNQSSKDVEVIYSDSGKMMTKLIAPTVEHYEKDTSYFLFPKGIHVLFFDNNSKVKTELTAKYGIRYETLGRMEARN